MSDNTNGTAASPTALAYLQAATSILQALATDAGAIAAGVGAPKVAGHIGDALARFQGVQQPVQDLEQLAVGLFGFFGNLAHAHAAAKQAGG